ncbi:MAG: glycine cleavage system aminomethyltransferase GcvT [Verrucomicrobiae bacterium]|nr:glycine cleavage system aminomethyltransferase GcvT [Verrucomicrobiae bacterium]
MASTHLKRTALYESHLQAGAKIVPFAGWEMPVSYTSIMEEHKAVRNEAGVFDISHMGEFFVSGAAAKEALNVCLTNDVALLQPGQGQYTLLLNEQGGVIDDLIVYCLEETHYLLVVNASKIEEDFAWLKRHLPNGVLLEDRSENYSALALQGPQAVEVLKKIFSLKEEAIPARFHLTSIPWKEKTVFVARTGYTGEDGVELFLSRNDGVEIWDLLLKEGVKPVGLGARDSLRLEACYPLNGNDLNETTTPLEAGLGFAVVLNKADFVGKKVLAEQKEKGVPRKAVAFSVKGKGAPPRSHYILRKNHEKVGEVTSGGFSPSLGKGIGMGYVSPEYAKIGTELVMEVRGQEVPVVIEKKPLYKKQ